MTLQGSIDSFPLADVLRLLGSTHKSGALSLRGDRGSGRLWMAGGDVVAGETSVVGSTPVDASLGDVLFDMLRYGAGDFDFDAEVAAPDTTTSEAVDALLDQVERDMAEWHAITDTIPATSCSLELVDELTDAEVRLDRRLWSGIAAVAGGARVDEIGRRLALADLPVMRLARDLVGAGVARVTVAPASTMSTSSTYFSRPAADPPEVLPDVLHDVFSEMANEAEAHEPEPHEPEPAAADATVYALDSFTSEQFVPVADEELDALFDTPVRTEGLPPLFADEPVVHTVTHEDTAPEEPDLIRQLSGLSPSAARAIAAATASGDEPSQHAAHTFGGLSGTL